MLYTTSLGQKPVKLYSKQANICSSWMRFQSSWSVNYEILPLRYPLDFRHWKMLPWFFVQSSSGMPQGLIDAAVLWTKIFCTYTAVPTSRFLSTARSIRRYWKWDHHPSVRFYQLHHSRLYCVGAELELIMTMPPVHRNEPHSCSISMYSKHRQVSLNAVQLRKVHHHSIWRLSSRL